MNLPSSSPANPKNKDYKVALIYLPLVLPLITHWCVFEGLLEDPNATSSLIKLYPLAKLWALATTEARSIRSDFHRSNIFQLLLPHKGDENPTTTSPTLSLRLLHTASLKDFGDTYALGTFQLKSHIFFEDYPTLRPGYLPKNPTTSTKDTNNTIS